MISKGGAIAVGVTTLGLNWLVLVPMIIYTVYLVNKFGDARFLRTRGKSTLVLLFSLFGYLGGFHLSVGSLIISFNLLKFTPLVISLSFSNWILTVIAILVLHLHRVWSFYYVFRYKRASASKLWKETLSQDAVVKDWFLQNVRTWGDSRFTGRAIFVAWVVVSAGLIVLSELTQTGELTFSRQYVIVQSVVFLLLLVCYAKMYVSISPCFDVYGVRDELFAYILAAGPCLLVYGLVHLIPLSSEHRLLLHLLVVTLLLLLCTYISGIHMLHLHEVSLNMDSEMVLEYIQRDRNRHTIAERLKNRSAKSVLGLDEGEKAQAAGNDTIANMKILISDRQGLPLFMDYLVKEFASENLLFLVEITQIMNILDIYPNTNHLDIPDLWSLDLPNDLVTADIAKDLASALSPRQTTSSIPSARTQETEIDFDQQLFKAQYDAFNKIYDKYIAIYSPLEINIDSSARLEIVGLHDEPNRDAIRDGEDLEKFIKAFVDAAKQILRLLKSSFRNFKMTPEYESWVSARKISSTRGLRQFVFNSTTSMSSGSKV